MHIHKLFALDDTKLCFLYMLYIRPGESEGGLKEILSGDFFENILFTNTAAGPDLALAGPVIRNRKNNLQQSIRSIFIGWYPY